MGDRCGGPTAQSCPLPTGGLIRQGSTLFLPPLAAPELSQKQHTNPQKQGVEITRAMTSDLLHPLSSR